MLNKYYRLNIIMDVLLFKTLSAGIGISLCASILGCFIVWQKMSYFGDSMSHSILLGVIIGVCFHISPIISGLLFAIIIAYLFNISSGINSNDSILGLISQSCLAISLIVNAYNRNTKTDLNYYLFGDILAIDKNDLIQIYILLILILVWIYYRYQSLLIITISKELAYSEKIQVNKIKLEFTLFIAILISFAIKIVGSLLINAMLIMPAITARIISYSPRNMIVNSIYISLFSTITGIILSDILDLPPNSLIIAANLFCFLNLTIYKRIFR